MTQFNTPTPRHHGGDIDVFTGLLGAAVLVLAAGVFLVATANTKHSASNASQDDGGMVKIIDNR